MSSRKPATAPLAGLVWSVALLLAACSEEPAGPAAADQTPSGATPVLLDDDDDFDSDEVLVRLAAGVRISDINRRYGTRTLESVPAKHVYLLDVPDDRTLEELLAQMAGDPDLTAAEPNRRLEAPEANGSSMAFADPSLRSPDYVDQHALDRIRAPEAWAYAQGAGALVAVLDTGVQAAHPALSGRIATGGWDFVDGDSNPADRADAVDSDGDALVDEAYGHGTFTAGLILAVAPKASILPVRVLDSDGVGTAFDVAQGIELAQGRGARVVNMSLGMTVASDVLEELIDEADDGPAVFVSSAGNRNVTSPAQFPAGEEEVIGVAATNRRDYKASFSNYGSWVRVAAPGVGLVGPYPGGGFATWSGTSFASALASGEAALLVSARPGATAERVMTVMQRSAVQVNDPKLLGTGRIDALAAVTRILASAPSGGGGDDDDDD